MRNPQSVEQLDAFPKTGEEDRMLGLWIEGGGQEVGNARNRSSHRMGAWASLGSEEPRYPRCYLARCQFDAQVLFDGVARSEL